MVMEFLRLQTWHSRVIFTRFSLLAIVLAHFPLLSDLLDDLGDAAGADGAATLTDGETETFVHGDRLAQLHRHQHVVTRHHHLRALRQLDRARHIRRPEEELRPVVVEERLVPTPPLLPP